MNLINADDKWFELIADAEMLTAKYVAKALLEQQYLPNIKKLGEELPPIFSSTSFTIKAAEAIKALEPKFAAWVELRTRRYDGLVRRLGIPHPVPYSKLVLHVRDHWRDLEKKLDSPQSQINARWHPDGRVIQMDYSDHAEQHGRHTRLALGMNYMVKADISNCFPSIYTHALDWALRGKAVAKADRTNKTWEAKVDLFARGCVNNETKGILIGPAVSNVLSELVLQRIDADLGLVTFARYIDDYSAYFATREDAEAFVVTLQRALAVYRLDLNTRKTHIVSLRDGIGDAWMAEVLSHLPAENSDLSVARFLQQAEILARRHPGQSVLKFAAKTILGREARTDTSSLLVVHELTRITHFHPHLLSVLSAEIAKLGKPTSAEREDIAATLRAQLDLAINRAETDSILWLMYIVVKQLRRPLRLSSTVFQMLLDLNDDLVWISTAALVPKRAERIRNHIGDLAYADEADRQLHWIARYEFWRTDRLKTMALSASEQGWMKALANEAVVFSSLATP